MPTTARALQAHSPDDSGVRRRPRRGDDDLPDLSYLVRAIEPPPVPLTRRPRRPPQGRPAERVDFDTLLAGYRSSCEPPDSYFPSVPGIPQLVLRPEPSTHLGRPLDAGRAAVLVAAAVAGALLALL